jgi:type VI secretion system protein ImpA
VAGLREVLELMRGYLENFWDTVYPELDDGDPEYRAAPLQWVGDRLEAGVKRTGLTRGGLDWFQYKESRAIGTEAAADTDEKRTVRLDAIADGKMPQEQFDKAFDETPKRFYVSLLETYDGTLESLSALGGVCDEKFGDLTPSFGNLKRALEEVRQTVYILLQVKREKEPDEPTAEAQAEEQVLEEPVPVQGGAAAAPARARKPVESLTADPVDRADAVARVVAAAKYLRAENQYDPAPYLILRGLRWGELRAAGETIDQTMLAPPPTEIRQSLKQLSLESNWTGVLETAESAMGMECGRGWLDLQRYVARACYELGSYHEPIRSSVISGLRGLLADYPKLPALTMMDDTPTANVETAAWINEQVLAGPAASVRAYGSEPHNEAAEGEPGAPAPPDVFELAMQSARQGRPQDGIELLMREMAQEPSGRGRFHRKIQLAQLCVSSGHDGVAFPILQEAAAEIERRRLEDWETSDMVAHPLVLLYKCLVKSGSTAEEIQKLYSWICRLDPLAAMKVSR